MLRDVVNRIRRNHALEHATVTLLLNRGISPPLGGYSTAGGFFIFGQVSTDIVAAAAHDALERLRQGQRELAISPYCGTNLATGALIGGILAGLIMGRKKEGRVRRLPVSALAVVGGTFLGRPVGNVLQRSYTTLADMEDLEIAGISRLGNSSLHRIRTTAS
jgi:hypothetical protein